MPAAGAKISGDTQLLRKLRELGKKSVTLNRQAVNKGTTPIVRAAKAACPVAHGDLRKSLTKKVYNRGPNANGIVGADTAYIASKTNGEKLQIGKDKEENAAIVASAKEEGGIIRPAKYDHLVEFGHVSPGGKHIPAQPFLRNAWDSSIEQAQTTYEKSLAEGIEKAAT